MKIPRNSTNSVDSYRIRGTFGRNMRRRALVLTLSGVLLIQPLSVSSVLIASADASSSVQSQTAASQLKLQKEEMVTAGAKRLDYVWTSTRSGKTVSANVHVIEVDLSNPYVSLDVMSGSNNTIANLNTVTKMTVETGAVAGINADYFNMQAEGVPMGGQITGGQLVTSPSVLKGMYAFALSKDRVPVIDLFGFEGTVTATNGKQFQLAGINQTSYMTEPDSGTGQFSHANAMYIYTSAWTAAERPNSARSSTIPTEVLVRNGIVEEIAENRTLAMAVPKDGYILRTHGEAAKFVKANLIVGQPVTAAYNLIASSGAKKDPATYQMMVGGHTILVNDGQASAFSRDVAGISGTSARSRTAIGYSRDNKKVYLVTVEKSGNSSGMTVRELQSALVSLGVWKGLNLDGGGSTTMSDRGLGQSGIRLAHATENSGGTVQRRVANGVGVYTSAPKGSVKGIKASGKSTLFIGESTDYSLSAYDTYYNPVEPGDMKASWSASGGLGQFSGNTFTATKPGQATLTVKAGEGASDKMTVDIIGAAHLDELNVAASSSSLSSGAEIALPVRAKLKDGRDLQVPDSAIKWELVGFTGSVKNGKLKVDQLQKDVTAAYAIGRYDGYSTVAAFGVGTAVTEKSWETFENVAYPITFTATPAETKGTAKVIKGLPERPSGSALQIAYDFTAGTGGKWAYAVFNGNGVDVQGEPSSITADVYSDGSSNWLRAEIVDAKNKTHYVDLARPLDWNGWKTVKTDLSGLAMAYPVKVKRLYVTSPEKGQEERLATGEVYVDNIKFGYAGTIVAPDAPTIVLQVGKKSATIDGKAVSLDSAPVVVKGTTYLPLKFVSDAINGQVAWDNKAKRVTFIRAGKVLDMQLNSKNIIVNGKRKSVDVAPILRNGRTLVPVRVVTEELGLSVKWENITKQITIQ
ncbi:copper amine oxidase [Paenibacillaceae bacterium]|nr:copper amine oxidase [Paenibacillaceae bacterium]